MGVTLTNTRSMEAGSTRSSLDTALDSLLRAWVDMIQARHAAAAVDPWWHDHTELLTTIEEAAEGLGWRASVPAGDDWDLRVTCEEGTLAIRCIMAVIPIGTNGEERDVLSDTWRVLALSAEPPAGTCDVQLVVAIPCAFNAGTDLEALAAAHQWRDETAFPEDVTAIWFDGPSLLPRNEAGTAFPGFGLLVRSHGSGS